MSICKNVFLRCKVQSINHCLLPIVSHCFFVNHCLSIFFFIKIHLPFWFLQIVQNNPVPIHIGPNKVACPFCPKLMRCNAEMKRHIRTHTGEKPFACPMCSAAFSEKGSCKTHMRMVHGHIN